jgi:hypothetical protein
VAGFPFEGEASELHGLESTEMKRLPAISEHRVGQPNVCHTVLLESCSFPFGFQKKKSEDNN